MAHVTWMEYNDKITSLGLFTCYQCKNDLLSHGILSEKYGNICPSCFQRISENEEIGNCVENHSLSDLLDELYFPCKYKDQNCSEKSQFAELKLHEKLCLYRTTQCIFSQKCKWSGRRINLMKHLLESHKDKTFHNEDDKYIYEINIQEDNDSLYILQTSLGIFFIRIKYSQVIKKLYYKVYDYECKQPKWKYEFRLTIDSRQNLVCYKTSLNVSHTIETLSDFTEADATEVDLVLLEEALKTDKSLPLKSIIKVICKDDNIFIENSILNHMKCLKCHKILRPPIYQCFSGHSICSTCKNQKTQCTSCNEGFGNTRNYSLETLAYQVRYPCQFESNGCRMKTTLASNHELICDYRMYNCCLEKCIYKGTHVELMDHLRQEHRVSCFELIERVHLIKPINEECEGTVSRMCLINYNTIFMMTTSQDALHTYWYVNIVSTYNVTSTFIYELIVYDSKEPEKKLIRRGDLTHKQPHSFFSINKNCLQEFLYCDELSFYFAVTKQCLM